MMDTGSNGPPQVSVVIPTKDRAALLAETLQSIRNQSGVSLEVVVVDDGSQDPGAVDSIVSRLNDPRFKVLRHDLPQGVSAARNHGIAVAAAEWIGFCDDDDLWAPDKLCRQLAVLESSGRHWVYTGAVDITRATVVVKGSAPPTPERIVSELEKANIIPGGCSGVLAGRSALLEVGGFDLGLAPCADWDMWLKLLRLGPPACVADAMVAYRRHPQNMSLDERRMRADFAVVRARYGGANEADFRRYLFWWSLRAHRRARAFRHWLAAASARDRSFPARVLVTDLGYLLRNTSDAAFARANRRRRQDRSPSPVPSGDTGDPYLDAAKRWVAQYAMSGPRH
jgi:glycosyltransferase involved in cell wall biosynthesis